MSSLTCNNILRDKKMHIYYENEKILWLIDTCLCLLKGQLITKHYTFYTILNQYVAVIVPQIVNHYVSKFTNSRIYKKIDSR